MINYGILPLEFVDGRDLEKIRQGDTLLSPDIRNQVQRGDISLKNETGGYEIRARVVLSEREAEILLAGGQLAFAKARDSRG